MLRTGVCFFASAVKLFKSGLAEKALRRKPGPGQRLVRRMSPGVATCRVTWVGDGQADASYQRQINNRIRGVNDDSSV
jgi:hypothetical protein